MAPRKRLGLSLNAQVAMWHCGSTSPERCSTVTGQAPAQFCGPATASGKRRRSNTSACLPRSVLTFGQCSIQL
jgi:hypothetical protein